MFIEALFAATLAVGSQTVETGTDPATQLVLPGATASPDCGGLMGLAGRAFCVTAPLSALDALAEAYVKDLSGRGWLAADGAENRVVFVRRREGGGCSGLQMMAFHDSSKPASADSPGYLALAAVPGDLCATTPAGSVPPEPSAAQ